MKIPTPSDPPAARFARRVFLVAGLYGLASLLPLYVLEDALARAFPPAFTHPDHFYGFLGVTVAWQLAFLVIARDPVRYRLLMLPSIAEKLLPSLAIVVLVAGGRTPAAALVPTAIDVALGVLFVVAFLRLRRGGD